MREKGGVSILNRYNGSYTKAVLSIYPDIGLEESKFSKLPRMISVNIVDLLTVSLQKIIGATGSEGNRFSIIMRNRGALILTKCETGTQSTQMPSKEAKYAHFDSILNIYIIVRAVCLFWRTTIIPWQLHWLIFTQVLGSRNTTTAKNLVSSQL